MKLKYERPVQHIPFEYGDRFIPRRYSGFSDPACSILRAKYINTDIFKMKEKSGYWRLHKMDVFLRDIFGVDSSPGRVLNFSDNFNRMETITEPSVTNTTRLDWDCKPRKRPKAFIEAIHDLPALKKSYGKHVIDWSARNEIVAVLNLKMVMWTLFTEKTTAYLLFDLKAVAFDATGNYLALAVSLNRQPVVQIWDTAQYDKRYLVYTEELHCTPAVAASEVTALLWDRGPNIFCGCDCGTVFVFNLAKRAIVHHIKQPHACLIVEMKFSCKYQYLAAMDEAHNLTFFYWNGTSLQIHSHIPRRTPLSFDFHPWKNTEIVIAEIITGRIVVVDLRTKKMVASYSDKIKRCIIHKIAFNKLTAELAVSVEYKNPRTYEILILAAMDRVVDVLAGHEKYVQHMIWSPNGKILATAGEDQTFILWNFFGLPNLEDTCKIGHPKKPTEEGKKVQYFRTNTSSKLAQVIR